MNRIVAAALAVLTLSACAGITQEVVSPPRVDARTLDLSNPLQARETFYGSVAFQPADTGANIVVTLDGGDRPGLEDGIADQVFVMQRYSGSGRIRPFRIPGATLHYRGRGVLVVAPEPAHSWGFFLGDDPGREAAVQMARDRGRATLQEWFVFGISRRTVHWPMVGGYLRPEDVG